MAERPYNVLFLCTHNSARSVMAEALLRSLGAGRFNAFSAGSAPGTAVHPYTIDVLTTARLPVEGLRSKSWDEFAGPDAPRMDFTFTVCDSAAQEVCPIWPGQPMTAHWSFEDPSSFQGSEIEKRAVFLRIFREIQNRIRIFTALPIASLSEVALQKKVDEIGRTSLHLVG